MRIAARPLFLLEIMAFFVLDFPFLSTIIGVARDFAGQFFDKRIAAHTSKTACAAGIYRNVETHNKL